MIVFREKDFSILSSTLKGASLGGTIGGGVTFFRRRKPTKKEDDNERKKLDGMYTTKFIGGGLLIGAALGALVGTILDITKKVNRKKTVDARLMEKVLLDLKSSGFREGIDFTRDPKQATKMKSKVCIVISKYSGELRLLINVVKDSKLEGITTQIVKNIPNSSNVVTREGDKFNDIIISTISDGIVDAQLISGIAEKFIHNKYPVYLVEVG